MLADSFWGSSLGLMITLAAAFFTVYLLVTFLVGRTQEAGRRRALAKRLGRKKGGGDEGGVATEPDACADGDRPLHSFTCAVWVLLGSAPVTSTTSSGASART